MTEEEHVADFEARIARFKEVLEANTAADAGAETDPELEAARAIAAEIIMMAVMFGTDRLELYFHQIAAHAHLAARPGPDWSAFREAFGETCPPMLCAFRGGRRIEIQRPLASIGELACGFGMEPDDLRFFLFGKGIDPFYGKGDCEIYDVGAVFGAVQKERAARASRAHDAARIMAEMDMLAA